MPLVRIDLRKGKPSAYKKAIGDGIYRAMRETFTVPEEDRFMVVSDRPWPAANRLSVLGFDSFRTVDR